MRQALGIFILVVLFGVHFAAIARNVGFASTLKMFGTAFLVVGLVAFSAWLIAG